MINHLRRNSYWNNIRYMCPGMNLYKYSDMNKSTPRRILLYNRQYNHRSKNVHNHLGILQNNSSYNS